MTDEEIEEKRQRLLEIQKGTDKPKHIAGELLTLAREVGASTMCSYHIGKVAPQAVIIERINNALQTATMINMSKSSTRMCEVAARNYKIAIVAAIAAALSALAASLAVLTQ